MVKDNEKVENEKCTLYGMEYCEKTEMSFAS
jgi:hypothetical protein